VCLIVCNLEISNRGTLGPIWVAAPKKKVFVAIMIFLFQPKLKIPAKSTQEQAVYFLD
jgi:hypothetical protein